LCGQPTKLAEHAVQAQVVGISQHAPAKVGQAGPQDHRHVDIRGTSHDLLFYEAKRLRYHPQHQPRDNFLALDIANQAG
jgi:hypothetical protein